MYRFLLLYLLSIAIMGKCCKKFTVKAKKRVFYFDRCRRRTEPITRPTPASCIGVIVSPNVKNEINSVNGTSNANTTVAFSDPIRITPFVSVTIDRIFVTSA